jgi:superfamily II DNA or RNA helicase
VSRHPPPSSGSPFQISFDQGTLLLRGPAENAAVAEIFGPGIWRRDPRVSLWRCEAFHYRRVIMALWQRQLPFQDSARDWSDVTWPRNRIHSPRAEQAKAIESWLGDKRGVVVMPTGTGKTEVALHLLQQTACSTLVVAPVRDLMYQWHRRIQEGLGYDAGIVGDNTFDVRPVSVTTYDSAAIHAARLGNRFKLIVFDECHHLPGNFRRDAATMSIAPWRLGLTATPHRADGRHADFGFLIGPLVYELKIESVRGKTLADFDVIRIPVHLSGQEQSRYNECSRLVRSFMHERRQTDPGFRWEDLCSESAHDPLARQTLVAYRHKQSIEERAGEKLRVLEDLFRLHAGTPIIVFAGSNAMARDVSIRFLIPCLLNHCGKKERLDILNGLADGTWPAIVANQVLDEGVDVPAVKVAIVIGGTSSTRQAKQRLGRVLRKSGNARAILYEVVCQDTGEARRSRERRKSDAYAGTRHRRI